MDTNSPFWLPDVFPEQVFGRRVCMAHSVRLIDDTGGRRCLDGLLVDDIESEHLEKLRYDGRRQGFT
jgi:hypothetical protein